ncbi:flavodoxin domain-containing protein [Herbiconiux sp. CPCC 205763]|uniref:Flavodoxin domain-containing protein n=1 Tax=Herbiconiux aconitum TaxID=2970913 RepID=A0ABT2GPI9_9MICO|nr:flavodoxin domain-containing protein [Herbiconiux aconitum]MCS5718138.1 flavodoxin domain-containing protein [Herbiconiux aconitum]
MRAVVVYESMFGNTRQIAEAIADGLRERAEVTVVDVNRVSPVDVASVDLMIVGGPTHVHGMTRANTRAEAEKWTLDPAKNLTLEPGAPGRGIRDWVYDPAAVVAPLFAAFATRADLPVIIGGNAATQIDRALHHRATRRLLPAENFLVSKNNILLFEEADRAREWGILIGATATARLANSYW